jgi:predicted TIM-barrel fold metal-dependent hydrolase
MGHHITNARLEGRREMLRWLAALSASTALGGCSSSCTSPSPATPPAALIDVHCHVFNVRDMPAYAFIADVTLSSVVLRDFASPIAKIIVEIARAAAPDFTQERDALVLIRANPAAAGAFIHSSAAPAAMFAAGLVRFMTRYNPFPTIPAPPTIDQAFIQKLLDTFIPGVVDLTQPPLAIVASIIANRNVLAAAIQAALAPGAGVDLKSYLAQFLMYWAPRLADFRFQLVEELAGFSGGSPPPPRLMTPATLDITAWLEDSIIDYVPTPLHDQAVLMGQISLIQPPGRAVHGFIGFDPWRQVDDLANGVPDASTALGVVKFAIETQGFVGVKLYPPMGFQATGNANLADSDFPTFPASHPGIGTLLDAALDSLYTYCAANDVPIMAHCAASEGTSQQYAMRADPAFWKLVLDKPAFKNLRLNLGHFGGIWNFDGAAATASDPHVTWTKTIAEMMQSGNYPNLYADLGDFSAILDRTAGETTDTNAILANLKVLVSANPVARSRVMYGTDWLLLGREPQSLQYYAKMQAQLADALGVSDLSDLFWKNASRYLGMASGQPTRVRLTKFYTDNGGNPAVLNAFA